MSLSPDRAAPGREESGGSGRRALRIRPLVWPRLPIYLELAIIGIGYYVYSLGRVAAPEKESVAMFHAQQIMDLQEMLRIDIELVANEIVTSMDWLADAFGYFYGTAHFVVTPGVLIWLYFRRPGSYARLRSAITITTISALVCYWLWPLAPPRFALPGTTDTLIDRNIFGAGNPDGPSGMVNLYAAMPSLHVAWSYWVAMAVLLTTTTVWRRLVWLYPIATVVVVVGTANHFILDAVGGLLVVMLGLFMTTSKPLGKAIKHEDIVIDETTPEALAAQAELDLMSAAAAGADAESGAADGDAALQRESPADRAGAPRADRT